VYKIPQQQWGQDQFGDGRPSSAKAERPLQRPSLSAPSREAVSEVRCAFSSRNLQSRMPLDPTHVRFNLSEVHSSYRLTL
jgi:hypothetical protein